MKKISGRIFLQKRVFPFIWFGFLGVLGVGVGLGRGEGQGPPFALIVIFMAVFGFFVMRKLVWDLVDEVYDCGTFLLIRNGPEEDSVPLANIMNVSVALFQNPKRITLRLITPGKFGSEISFSPVTPFTLNPFAKNQVAEDLIQRVYEQRAKRGF